jgi:hypothetical protein
MPGGTTRCFARRALAPVAGATPGEIVIKFAIGFRRLERELEPASGPDDQAGMSAAGIAAGLGCSIVVSVIICIGGGIALDEWLDRAPLFTLIGVAIGLAAAIYQLAELAKVGRKDRAPGPLARSIARVPFRKGREKQR